MKIMIEKKIILNGFKFLKRPYKSLIIDNTTVRPNKIFIDL